VGFLGRVIVPPGLGFTSRRERRIRENNCFFQAICFDKVNMKDFDMKKIAAFLMFVSLFQCNHSSYAVGIPAVAKNVAHCIVAGVLKTQDYVSSKFPMSNRTKLIIGLTANIIILIGCVCRLHLYFKDIGKGNNEKKYLIVERQNLIDAISQCQGRSMALKISEE
jgi:hypothetical protein